MDLETLKERIESLDPVLHRALRRALLAEYERRVGQAGVDPFEQVFRQAAGEIADRYIQGTDDYVRQHHPDLYQRIGEAGERMNEAWTAGRQGRATIEEFRESLGRWKALHLEGVEVFAKHRASRSPGTEVGARG